MSEDVNPFQLAILRGMQTKPQYQGLTEAQWAQVEKRRVRNKRAAKARREARPRARP